AHQWWWEFDYPSLGVRTSDVLYLPSDTNVQLKLISGDVLHSFWIEEMKDSIHVIPGEERLFRVFVRSLGEVDGNCGSGCGCGTVCMRFCMLASAPWEFQRWATGARLHPVEFKVPQATDSSPCTLGIGHEGRLKRNRPAKRLQR